uniref:Uncharacterized protein LOC105130257 n=1 Tax=Rhizophora mucronata TaxID=61149 RepID=A0A2P2IYJ1_RHIMU
MGNRTGKRAAAMVRRAAYAPKGSVVNAQIRAKETPPCSSNLGKFLGIPPPPRSDFSKLISKFVKLNNRQNPGMKKDFLPGKLSVMLEGKEKVGIPEIAKLLAQQFTKGG